jgi:hypothetical protein
MKAATPNRLSASVKYGLYSTADAACLRRMAYFQFHPETENANTKNL